MDYKEKIISILTNKELTSEQKRQLETIFPELAESDDERIRQALVRFHKSTIDIDGIKGENILAWLEKQGESPSEDFGEFTNELSKQFPEVSFAKLSRIAIRVKKWVEQQDEQKPADKVEPKFKVGVWVVNKGHSYLIADIDYEQRRYLFEIGGYTHEQLNWEYIENADNKYHLWTIQDAKDGDVLCGGQIILLFKQWKGNTDYNFVIAHAGIDISGKLQVTDGRWLISNESKPAAKEQRDLLFQKMKEAGYEWDADKKELKKIEQKIAWCEEDEKTGEQVIYAIN